MSKLVNSIIDKVNNTGLEQFDGLSPAQMKDLIDSKNHLFKFSLNPKNNLIDEIPLIQQIRFFLNQLNSEGGIKLTKTGNLPPVIVKELYSRRFLIDEAIDNGITKLTKETDSDTITLPKYLCLFSSLIIKKNGYLRLTKKGKESQNSNELFPLIYQTFSEKLNWSDFDGYTNKIIGQAMSKFSLYLLHKYGDEERNVNFYAERYFKAFPSIVTDVEPYTKNEHIYSLRTFERFLKYFGFIKLKVLGIDGMLVRKSVTFDRFIEVKLKS